ncbi:MAG: hypothetical protein IKT41_03420 [Clostridia bacterium]|nr:hypothetical protein [Clostridia bacterium]
MVFIVIFNIILYAVLLVWTCKNMYNIENKPKIIYIILSIILVYILTKIIYNLGENPIGKNYGEAAITFNRTMQIIFAGINGLTIIPYIGNLLNKLKEKVLDVKGFKKRILIIIVIFVVFLIFEYHYMKDMQVNMLEMINNK